MRRLLMILVLACGCTSSEMADMPNNNSSNYKIISGTTVYCWHVKFKQTDLQGYTYDDGTRGDVPPLVGKPFPDLESMTKHMKQHGAASIILAPFYPSTSSSEWWIRPLTLLEQHEMGQWIRIDAVQEQ